MVNSNLKEGSIIQGTISEVEDDAVIVDIGAKVEGRISKREFAFQKDNSELSVGDKIDVYLEKIENHNGDCVLSRSKAKSKIRGSIKKIISKDSEKIGREILGKKLGKYGLDIQSTAVIEKLKEFAIDLN